MSCGVLRTFATVTVQTAQWKPQNESPMRLIQTAVAAKFVVELFPNICCIVHRCIYNNIAREEWDCGPSSGRFGSLRCTMQRERGQRDRIMTLGVVDIPDKLPDDDPFADDMHKKLA